MKRPALCIVILIMWYNTLSAQQQKYSKVTVFLEGRSLYELAALGVALDGGTAREGLFFTGELSEYDLQLLQNNDFSYHILIEDLAAWYRERNAAPATKDISSDCSGTTGSYLTPEHFRLGSMGGFLTYSEILTELDSMASVFPDLISIKQPVTDTLFSVEERPVYYMKISDNPGTEENEPELLYTALHHTREPASMQQLIFFMWYLLENYDANPEIQYIVDNTELFFIPCVNPDGYIYNETTDPAGGGMWRKNRRNNGNSTYGVDINRNYGYEWGYDNTGSSPDGNSDSYRGTCPFSEPEPRIIKAFCESKEFVFAINYHTYSDLLIFPWGYEENWFTPDHNLFLSYSSLMTSENHYRYGTANQTVGYTGNGTSDDWMYGEQSAKEKIFAFSPEAGNAIDGFWPVTERIEDICKINVGMNLFLARFTLKYAVAEDLSPHELSSLQGYVPFSLQCFGLDTPATFTVSIIPVSGIQSAGNPVIHTEMNLFEEVTDSVSYTLLPTLQQGQEITFVLSVDNGEVAFLDTITKIYGQPVTIFFDQGDNLNNWTSTTWGTTTADFYSASGSITDSPSGNYPFFSNTTITLNEPVDLSSSIYAVLRFYTKWDVTPDYDYAQLSASNNGGATWIPLCGKYTTMGGNNEPVYIGTQDEWVQEEIDLSDFLGGNIIFRFELNCGFVFTADGYYFDDFTVTVIEEGYTGNSGSEEKFVIGEPHPNPANSVVSIPYYLPESVPDAILELRTVTGRLVSLNNLEGRNSNYRCDISGLSSGIYFCRIVSQKGKSSVKKLIIL
ncbi:MAG: immune inhibitor A [Bacteroidetes bacterium]|nr:immune inhibitor A [Bacteroidota bacterium]